MAIITSVSGLEEAIAKSLQMQPNSFPKELRPYPYFVEWVPTPKTYKDGRGIKLLKRPRDPDWTRKAQNSRLEDCDLSQYGVGFRYTIDHPYVCLDFDDPNSLEIVERFGSYSEVSPSGAGYHVIVECSDKEDFKFSKSMVGPAEVYVSSGYVTLTGATLPSSKPIKIMTIAEIYALLGEPIEPIEVGPVDPVGPEEDVEDSDEDYSDVDAVATQVEREPLSARKVRELLRLVPVKSLKGDTLNNLFTGKEVNLDVTSGTEDYLAWIKIGQAIHNNFRGSLEGFQIYNEWSKEGDNYDPEVIGEKWESFRDKPHGNISIGLLIKLAAAQRPEFVDKGKRGALLPTIGNLVAYLQYCQLELFWDEVSKQSKLAMSHRAAARWHLKEFTSELAISEAAAYICTDLVSFGFAASSYGESKLKKMLSARCRLSPRNKIRDYFIKCGRAWDGEDRMEELFNTLTLRWPQYGAAYKVFLRKWMLQVIIAALQDSNTNSPARINQMLILIGNQEIGKSNWLVSLFPKELREHCAEKRLHFGGGYRSDSTKLTMELSNLLICCLNEVDVYFTHTGASELKIFLDETADSVVLPYGDTPTKMVRRTVFAGSANKANFLRDPTGNRRFLCIELDDVNSHHTVDVDQLWGQLYNLWVSGEQHWLHPDNEVDKRVMIIRDEINSGLMHFSDEGIQEQLYYTFDVEEGKKSLQYERRSLSDILTAMGISLSINSKAFVAAKQTVFAWSLAMTGRPPEQSGNIRSKVFYWMPPLREEPVKELMEAEEVPPIDTRIEALKAQLAQLEGMKDEFNR